MLENEHVGIVLINTGSPDAPDTARTRAYLRRFLSDPRVIDIAPAAHWALLNFIILPFRPKHSAQAYRQVWTDQGSPLMVHSAALREALRQALPHAEIEIAMAYGRPSIPDSIRALMEKRVKRIVVVPMFPQYASATVGSVLELTYSTCAKFRNVPALAVVPPFYDDPGYLDAWAEVARPQLDDFKPDHIIISYHGLPERQIRKCDPSGTHCLQSETCCERFQDNNPDCYRAQCLATTRGIVARLGCAENEYTVAFQSKLGRAPWLSPATNAEVVRTAAQGIKRLAIISPSFVADCLETLEEIGLRAKEDFMKSGGEAFKLVSSLNRHPAWISALSRLIGRV